MVVPFAIIEGPKKIKVLSESITSVLRKLENRELSSQELIAEQLSRIEKVNPSFQAYSHVMRDEAIAAAANADRLRDKKRPLGPLHGVPIAVKDLLDVEGVPTLCGSRVLDAKNAQMDAHVVRKLRAAGAVILGKLNMTEFAFAAVHPDIPPVKNPWGLDRWPGVSSSGSAVAATACMAFATLGSDTGGSIRLPAAVNGVVGVKPTFGSVGRSGAFPLAYTLDHIGPITRFVEDAALVLQVIQGPDSKDPFSNPGNRRNPLVDLASGIEGCRLGLDEAYLESHADTEVVAAVRRAVEQLSRLGARVVPVNVMDVLGVTRYWGPVVAAEARFAHTDLYPVLADRYGQSFKDLLDFGEQVSARTITKARVMAARARQCLMSSFEEADVIVCPGAPFPAMPLDCCPPSSVLPPEFADSVLAYSTPMNFSGVPTVTSPAGLSRDGLPMGVQFVGNSDSEPLLLRVAFALQESDSDLGRWCMPTGLV